MKNKFISLILSMFLVMTLGWFCYPIFNQNPIENPIVTEIVNKPDVIEINDYEDDYVPPAGIVIDEAGVDDGENPWDTEDFDTSKGSHIADTVGDDGNYEIDDSHVEELQAVKEFIDIPVDPKQNRVSPIADKGRRVDIISSTRRIAQLIAREEKRGGIEAVDEFGPETWTDPGKIQQLVGERVFKKLGSGSPDDIEKFMFDPANRRDVAILYLIQKAGVDTIKDIAKKHMGKSMLSTLSSDLSWLEDTLYSGPTDNFDSALSYIAGLFTKYSELIDDPIARRLATTGALEFAREGWSEEDLQARFWHYYTSHSEGKLNKKFNDLQYWETRFIMGAVQPGKWGSVRNLKWMRDNVRLPESQYSGAAYQVAYNLRNMAGDSVHGSDYLVASMKYHKGVIAHAHRSVGGVCGALSHYGTFAAIANGLPAATMGEPGHCAYATRVNGKWNACNSIYWKKSLHKTFWREPAWDFLILTQELYGDRYATLVSDQMRALGDVCAANKKMLSAFYCYENSVIGQPYNWPAWLNYLGYLQAKSPENGEKWAEASTLINEGMNTKFHNAAATLQLKYVYPKLAVHLKDFRKIAQIYARFFRKCKTWGNNRWEIDPLLSTQLNTFTTLKDQSRFMKEAISQLIRHPDYSGAAIAWALDFCSRLPEGKEKNEIEEEFSDVIIRALRNTGRGKNNAEASWKALGEAAFTASSNADRRMFQAIGKLAWKKFPKRYTKNKFRIKGVSGALISTTGLITSDKTIDPGGDCNLHWAVLQRAGGYINGKSSISVELEKTALVNGVVCLTQSPMATNRPFLLEVSEDGQNWSQGAIVAASGNVIRFDFRKKKLQGRFIRMSIQGEMLAEDMTKGIPVVGFYVYGKANRR